MSERRATLVAISAFALNFSCHVPAWAQIQISCTQRLYVGEHDACGNGFITVNPDGSIGATNGCRVTTTPPQPGKCVLSTGGAPVTRNVVVKFATPSIFINAGGQKAQVNTLRMDHSTAATPAAQFTFTPTQVSNTVTLDIGGRLNFSTSQAIGTYTGQITIDANLN